MSDEQVQPEPQRRREGGDFEEEPGRRRTAGGTGHAIAGTVPGTLVLPGHLAGIVLIVVAAASK